MAAAATSSSLVIVHKFKVQPPAPAASPWMGRTHCPLLRRPVVDRSAPPISFSLRSAPPLDSLVHQFDPMIPIEEAVTPPSSWYTDSSFLDLELDRIFHRGWQVVGQGLAPSLPLYLISLFVCPYHGTVLTFQLLSPIFTNLGRCDSVSRSMTSVLLFLCGLSSFVLSFTDSFRDRKGNVSYGFATRAGLWVIDGSGALPPELADQYRLRFVDFLHAFMSLLVFSAITLFDQNVVNCFYPTPSDEAKELLTGLPVAIGIVSSMMFVVFPTKRHGVGFPVSKD